MAESKILLLVEYIGYGSVVLRRRPKNEAFKTVKLTLSTPLLLYLKAKIDRVLVE